MALGKESMREPTTAPEQAWVADAPAPVPESEKESSKMAQCPLCQGDLIKHGDENPYKAGASHCNKCGSCWKPGLKEQREGHAPPIKVPSN